MVFFMFFPIKTVDGWTAVDGQTAVDRRTAVDRPEVDRQTAGSRTDG